MQAEIIEEIIHLPILERVKIIEKISRSVREDLRKSSAELSFEERKKATDRLRGIAAVEGKMPPTDEEVKENYTRFLSEKYK